MLLERFTGIKVGVYTLLNEEFICPMVQGSNFLKRGRLEFFFQIMNPFNASIKSHPFGRSPGKKCAYKTYVFCQQKNVSLYMDFSLQCEHSEVMMMPSA